ncbi:MAG: response regulator [Bacillota bacterium]|nr:response regulator [Bacillota bacterium]
MNIVITEGDERSRKMLLSAIHRYDPALSCHICSDPDAVMKMAAKKQIDLAFLDIQLTAMSGLELARRLKSINPQIKIVFTTSFNQYAAEAFDLEVQDYLLKPFNQERLLKTLDKILLSRTEQRYILRSRQANLLQIELFGKLVVYHGQKTLKWKRSKSAELFAYLLTYLNKPVSKHQICESLWPDKPTDKALINLQTAIYQLRKNLSEFSRDQIIIEYADNDYRMLVGPCYVDVHAFEDAYYRAFASPPYLGNATNATQNRALIEAYNLYKDHYLVQEGWLWAMPKQQSLAQHFNRILDALIDNAIINGAKSLLQEYLARMADLLGESEMDLEAYLEYRKDR